MSLSYNVTCWIQKSSLPLINSLEHFIKHLVPVEHWPRDRCRHEGALSWFSRTQQYVGEIRQIHTQPDFKKNVTHKRGMDKDCCACVIMKVRYKSFWDYVKLLVRIFPGRTQGICSFCDLCNIHAAIFANYLNHTQHKQGFPNDLRKTFIHIQKVIFSLWVCELFHVRLTHSAQISLFFVLPKTKLGKKAITKEYNIQKS